MLLALALGACAPRERAAPRAGAAAADSAFALPVEWLADSSRGSALPVRPPPAVWALRVTPSRPAAPDPPLPAAPPAVPEGAPAPPALAIEPGLKPPIPRRTGRIAVPAGASLPASVELDVEVDETGAVRDAVWSGGATDSALVHAAIACARSMAFFPALKGGEPVAVWCRQRFDFAR